MGSIWMEARAVAFVVFATMLFCAPASLGAAWVPVTGPTSSIAEVDQARTPDGVLHVAWSRDTPGSSPTTQDVVTTTVDEAATPPSAAAPTIIASGFSFAGSPALVVLPGGTLQVFFGAIQCTDSGCPLGLFTATSSDAGATWTPPTVLFDRDQAYGSFLSAAVLSDGTPFQTWWASGVIVHRGLDPNTPDYDFQAAMGGGCCGYFSNLAADATGHMELAWDSNSGSSPGVWAQAVDPGTGSPFGSPMLMPGSVTDSGGSPAHITMLGRTPVLAVPGESGAFYVAYPVGYPSPTVVALWRVGSATTETVVDDQNPHYAVALAADGAGRVWVFWSSVSADGSHVFARRLGAQGFEPAVDLGAPANVTSVYAIAAGVLPNGDPVALARAARADGTTETFYTHGPQTATPQNGRTVGAAPVSGRVRYRPPGSKTFVDLAAGEEIPVGSTIDVTHGRVRLTAERAHGGTETSDFSAGSFRITQRRGKSLANLVLAGGNFRACRGRSVRTPGLAMAAKRRRVRHLSGNGKGSFRTRGRYAAATVRGTIWDTEDDCDGTRVSVRRGVVRVLDLVRHRTVTVRAGHSYFAAAPGRGPR